MHRGDFAAGWKPFVSRVWRLCGEFAEAFTGRNWRRGALALMTLGTGVALYLIDRRLYTEAAPSKMSLEFAGNERTAAAIALSWQEVNALPAA